MAHRLRHLALLAAGFLLLVGTGSASQITLGESTGQIVFTNEGSHLVDFNFNGTCGHPNCISGLGLFGSTIGSYKIWIAGGPPQLEPPNSFDIYPVNEEGATVNFSMVLNGGLGSITGLIDLQLLSGGSTFGPEFLGSFTAETTSGLFVGAFPIGTALDDDFTINLTHSMDVDAVYQDVTHSIHGPLSSGEILTTPEPSTLGLLGGGLLTMAGLLKRRLF